MKKISIFTLLAAILSFSSCEEDSVSGCTDSTATNYNSSATDDDLSCMYPNEVSELLIGSWTSDSSEVRMILSEEMLTIFMMYSEEITPEEFEEELGFEMPSSEEEWAQIAEEGLQVESEGYQGNINITDSTFTINQMEGDITNLEYVLVNENRIEFINPDFNEEEDDFEYFDIVNISETSLTLSSRIIEQDDDEEAVEYSVLIYLSK